MPSRPAKFQPPHARSRVEANREADARRGSARQRGYDRVWECASANYRREHPLCEYCLAGAFGHEPGDVTPAELVDHLYPHRGDMGLFWDERLWVASCKADHDGPKQAAERQGRAALDALARLLGRPTLPTPSR